MTASAGSGPEPMSPQSRCACGDGLVGYRHGARHREDVCGWGEASLSGSETRPSRQASECGRSDSHAGHEFRRQSDLGVSWRCLGVKPRVCQFCGLDNPACDLGSCVHEHFQGCPTPVGRSFDCDWCQERSRVQEA